MSTAHRLELPVEVLREHFGYDEAQGHLFWIKQTRGRALFKPLGLTAKTPYIQIGFERRIFLAHRILFALYHGYWAREIDHVNGDRRDNRKCNLREVTRAENTVNRKRPHSRNTSGHTGVMWNKRLGKWEARIKKDGVIRTQFFTLKEHAIACRAEMVRELYPTIND